MSEQPRVWGIRLLALGIAVGIWFNASVRDRLVSSERVVEVGVRYNRPRGFVILDPVRNVNVRLSGSQRAIRQLNPSQIDVQAELSQRQEGEVTVNLTSKDVQVPEGLSVVAIQPSTLAMRLDREETQRLRVLPKLSGEPAGGARVSHVDAVPDTVVVTGPASLLRRFQEAPTAPVSLDGREVSFEETVPVLSPDALIQILQPSVVTLKVELEPARSPGAKTGRRKEGA